MITVAPGKPPARMPRPTTRSIAASRLADMPTAAGGFPGRPSPNPSAIAARRETSTWWLRRIQDSSESAALSGRCHPLDLMRDTSEPRRMFRGGHSWANRTTEGKPLLSNLLQAAHLRDEWPMLWSPRNMPQRDCPFLPLQHAPTRSSVKKSNPRTSHRDSFGREDGMESDQLLIRRAIDGDERALRQLWSQYAPRIDAVVKRLAGDPDLAADIAQDVWIQIFRALKTYRGDAQFGTWAHRIAVNRTLNALRKVRRLAKVEMDIEEDSVSVEMDSDRSFVAASIEEAARKLPDGARTVFLLHDVEGYTHEDIARELGITPGASKSQLFKARAKLRRLLAHLVDHLPATSRAHVAPAS